jgi:hypothetical protein
MPRRRPEFEPGAAGAEAAKLFKFSDAGRTQIQWLSDAAQGPPKTHRLWGWALADSLFLSGRSIRNQFQDDCVAVNVTP